MQDKTNLERELLDMAQNAGQRLRGPFQSGFLQCIEEVATRLNLSDEVRNFSTLDEAAPPSSFPTLAEFDPEHPLLDQGQRLTDAQIIAFEGFGPIEQAKFYFDRRNADGRTHRQMVTALLAEQSPAPQVDHTDIATKIRRLRKDEARGDTVFRCGFNGAIDAVLKILAADCVAPQASEQADVAELLQIVRSSPDFLLLHIEQDTNYDAKQLARVFELAKERATELLAAKGPE